MCRKKGCPVLTRRLYNRTRKKKKKNYIPWTWKNKICFPLFYILFLRLEKDAGTGMSNRTWCDIGIGTFAAAKKKKKKKEMLVTYMCVRTRQ